MNGTSVQLLFWADPFLSTNFSFPLPYMIVHASLLKLKTLDLDIFVLDIEKAILKSKEKDATKEYDFSSL